jgi:hypothetical protein
MTFVAAPERYDRMRYNRVGRSGLRLPALSLGLWHNFGHERPIETQRAIVRRAFDQRRPAAWKRRGELRADPGDRPRPLP